MEEGKSKLVIEDLKKRKRSYKGGDLESLEAGSTNSASEIGSASKRLRL